jgi:hypothetical protein
MVSKSRGKIHVETKATSELGIADSTNSEKKRITSQEDYKKMPHMNLYDLESGSMP